MLRSKILFVLLIAASLYAQVIPISEARSKSKGDSVNVEGIVFTTDYNLSSTTSSSYYIYDETGAINLFVSKGKKDLKIGDKVRVGGKIDIYNGLTEVIALPANIEVLSSDNPEPEPIVVTMDDVNNGEALEAKLVRINNVYRVGTTAWPQAGKDANLKFNTDPQATTGITIRIDKDTDIDENNEPNWPSDVIGVLTQFTTTGTGGYQILPRFYKDFLVTVSNEKVNKDKLTYSLEQNYPNPFNPTTKITFNMAKAGYVKVSVFNIMGQEVAVLFNGYAKEGQNVVNFNAAGLNSGIYFCKMEANEFKSMIKMMLIK